MKCSSGRALRSRKPAICYLCGQPLDGTRPENKDHIPPDQMLAPELRKPGAIALVTQPVHADCNSSYERDEKYFVQSLIPFARGSVAGDAIFKKAIASYKAGRNRPLVAKVLGQFSHQVNGIYMPPGKVALQVDQMRFDRIVRKIVRGLYFCEHGDILPADMEMAAQLVPPGEPPPDHFIWFMENVPTESKGHHQGAFAYRHYATDDGINYWALLLWDRVIITVMFRAPIREEERACSTS